MNMPVTRQAKTRNILFYSAATLFFITFYWLLPLYPQPEAYHHFSGDTPLFGIPNFMNVASNLFYIMAGVVGLYRLQQQKSVLPNVRWQYFFIALILVGLGSGYYHFAPTTHTLFWDRLPMSLGFAILSANFLAERYDACKGRTPLFLLLGFSLYSVIHWYLGEMIGLGDLRLYAITQFATIGIIATVLIINPQHRQLDRPYWILLIGYTIAKICEMLDPVIFEISQALLGGHVIKHMISGIALICFIPPTQKWLNLRSRIFTKSS